MKHIYIFCFLITPLLSVAQTMASNADDASGPVIAWENPVRDFGDIVQGEQVEDTFKFTNTGNEMLIITDVQVTCGCTVPKGWPTDPIPPGGSGEITIAFNSAAKYGKQNKVVKVISNSVGSQNDFTFTANVTKKTEEE